MQAGVTTDGKRFPIFSFIEGAVETPISVAVNKLPKNELEWRGTGCAACPRERQLSFLSICFARFSFTSLWRNGLGHSRLGIAMPIVVAAMPNEDTPLGA